MFIFKWVASTAPQANQGTIDFRVVYKLGVRNMNSAASYVGSNSQYSSAVVSVTNNINT